MNVREAISDMGMGELDRLAVAVENERFRRQNPSTTAADPMLSNENQRARQADMMAKAAAPAMLAGEGRAEGRPLRPGEITLDNVEDCFTFHAPDRYTLDRMTEVRESAIAMARVLLRSVPDCPDRSTAMRLLREARMWANSALALRGRF